MLEGLVLSPDVADDQRIVTAAAVTTGMFVIANGFVVLARHNLKPNPSTEEELEKANSD